MLCIVVHKVPSPKPANHPPIDTLGDRLELADAWSVAGTGYGGTGGASGASDGGAGDGGVGASAGAAGGSGEGGSAGTALSYVEAHYVSESGAGTHDGIDWTNAFSAADFNTSGNWASDAAEDNRIGPADIVHLADDITSQLTIQGSGSETGGDITISGGTIDRAGGKTGILGLVEKCNRFAPECRSTTMEHEHGNFRKILSD